MRWTFLTSAFLSVLGVASFSVAQNDVEFQLTSSNVRLLNERVRELEEQLASFEMPGHPLQSAGSCQKCGKGGGSQSCYCSPCPGLYADAELLLLYWHDTDDQLGQNAVHSGSRYTLGYMNSSGRGIQAKYFEFASVSDVGGGDLFVEHFDIEYAGRFTLGCNWRGELTLGGRWASMQSPEPELWQDTIGPKVGIGVWSAINDSLSIYGRASQSYQFGSEVSDPAAIEETDTFGISEIAIGLEASHTIGAASAFVRGGFEAQYYSSVLDDDEDFGFVGYTIAAGIRR